MKIKKTDITLGTIVSLVMSLVILVMGIEIHNMKDDIEYLERDNRRWETVAVRCIVKERKEAKISFGWHL